MNLLSDPYRHYIHIIREISTGINNVEISAIPEGLSIVAVSGNSVLIMNDRLSLSEQTIKKGWFTDVRTSYNWNYWKHFKC